MSEDSKKTQKKSKPEPKDQRKPRRQNQPPAGERKAERHAEELRSKVPAAPAKATPDPGPEFYKSLKRETDEILKITEGASKFKQKEIQSNWAKYEMPIESYDEIEEAENLGADYEKLIQTPMSSGGHFQFKHEKSWDVSTEPSMYDKYFQINMENLTTALLTIPFNERNDIDLAEFSETDKLTMENRSIKYKRKYFDDKSFTTAEIEAQDKIASKLSESKKKFDESIDTSDNTIDLELQNSVEVIQRVTKGSDSNTNVETSNLSSFDMNTVSEEQVKGNNNQNLVKSDDILAANVTKINIGSISSPGKLDVSISKGLDVTAARTNSKEAVSAKVPEVKSSKPIIENPDDLEKWLDDFLDG